MLKSLLSAATVTAGLVAPIALVATPANADTPTCVSKSEFRAVQKGWSITRVANRFDRNGNQTYYDSGDPSIDWPAYQSREYKPCRRYSYVSVSFEKEAGDVWRVTSKSAYWG